MGIGIIFEKENINTLDAKGEVLLTILSSLAQDESQSILENCIWGIRRRFETGKHKMSTKRFLGYDTNETGKLVINRTSDERKDEGELFKVALCNCEPIFLRFIKERILFRGGISYGDAYVDPSKSMFFGDAVNKAYKMESEIAIHPRIVIDDYIAEAVLENISSVKYKIVAKKPEYISILGAGLIKSI